MENVTDRINYNKTITTDDLIKDFQNKLEKQIDSQINLNYINYKIPEKFIKEFGAAECGKKIYDVCKKILKRQEYFIWNNDKCDSRGAARFSIYDIISHKNFTKNNVAFYGRNNELCTHCEDYTINCNKQHPYYGFYVNGLIIPI